ncbi:MAG: hypothetical protein H6607_10400 [Flavobacteriales bacterium]|nr:hypothetical protein [Flavobacteriales bacterium]
MNYEAIFQRHVDFAYECLCEHQKGKSFSFTINQYLKRHKKFGSRDRKVIRELCFCWFRLGFSFLFLEKRDQIIWAYTLLNQPEKKLVSDALLEEIIHLETSQKWQFIEQQFDWKLVDIFPFFDSISIQLDKEVFFEYVLSQPKLWVRVKNKKQKLPTKALELIGKQDINAPINLSYSTNLSGFESILEVQDFSSQTVLAKALNFSFSTLWDCCSGSGGKSLFILENKDNVKVYATDIRTSILQNFMERTARLKHCRSTLVCDISEEKKELLFPEKKIGKNFFDFIVADVPCTGSGTWNRNPEFKYCFLGDIEKYAELQKRILRNSWQFLKPGGVLLYSTCSVYAMENEDIVNEFVKQQKSEIIEIGYIDGSRHQSDSMFYAYVRKMEK